MQKQMKKQNWVQRILPIFLAAVLLIGIFPASAAPQDDATPVSAIVSEVVSLREECVKHFLCEDGTYIAATYASPVHYKANGEWKDIDNRLALNSRALSAAGKGTYTPRASAFPVSIPQAFSDGQQITVSNKGYTFGFGVSAEKQTVSLQSAATLVEVKALPSAFTSQREAGQEKQGKQTAAERVREYNAEKMAADNVSSAVVYEGLFRGTALEYIVMPNRLKENFVVTVPQAEYIYRFDVSMDGLVSMPQDDGSILLVAASNPEEAIFSLEAPYMYDAVGETSHAIEMVLVDGVLTVTADAAWLNADNRVFPAVIDPSVIINTNSQSVIKDTFVSSWAGSLNYISDAKLYSGKSLIGERTRTYVKFSLPTIPSNSRIAYAQFELMKVWTSASSVLNVRKLSTYWDPSTITWNMQPISATANSADSLPLVDSRNTASGSDVYRFDITSALKGWYYGSTTGNTNNNGLVITIPNENTIAQIDLYSSETSSTAQRPVLWFGYETDSTVYLFKTDTYSFENYDTCPDVDCNGFGHCFGMSATSSMYHLRLLNIANIYGNYTQGLYMLSTATPTIKAPICHYQDIQGSYSNQAIVAGGSWYLNYVSNITADWTALVNYVKSGNYNNKGSLQIGYRGVANGKLGGHSINFLRYEVVGGQERIYAYDNNFPNTETYFYKDASNKVQQAQGATFDSSSINCMALRSVSTYFGIAQQFNAAKVIYANQGVISVVGASEYPMDGDNRVMIEIPEQLSAVKIIPLVDNATFEYLGNTYSFGRSSANNIGRFRLAAPGVNPSLTISKS